MKKYQNSVNDTFYGGISGAKCESSRKRRAFFVMPKLASNEPTGTYESYGPTFCYNI